MPIVRYLGRAHQYLYGLARAGKPEADDLLEALQAHASRAPAFSRTTWAEVTVPLAQGLLAQARGDWELAMQRLGGVLPRLNDIGGSHAQRDLFAQLELDARLRSGDWRAAQQTLELRRGYDALDVPTNRHLQRVYSALGLPEQARQAAERVKQVLKAQNL